MRVDNSRHIIAAARQRRELTRAKAIQALRTLDNDGALVTFETVAQAADVSRSWLYAQPDIRAEINASAPPAAARRQHQSRPGNAARTPRYWKGWKPRTSATAGSPTKTTRYAANSPKLSANFASRAPTATHQAPAGNIAAR